ncbi:hypothetical protein Aperf_G00000090028 [Anoplocephala perfoliata]
MCHAECYNRSKTDVFALDVGEPPSPMQIRTGYNAYLHDYVNITSVVADGKETVFIDSVKSKILVLSENDTMLRCLDCNFYVREPSAMIAYEDDCYISDYMGHSGVVMDKEGRYKRSIGGEGLTDYPIGIEISRQSDVLPIQASQSVDGYQHPSAAFLHPDYHDYSKTSVLALSGGESPTDVHRGANSSLFTTAIPRKRTLSRYTFAVGFIENRVAVTENQRYVVCDRGQGCWRLQIFTPNGHFVRTIPLHNCVNITSVVADGNEIVVIDSVTSKIVVVSEDGRMLHCLDCSFYVRAPSAMITYEDDYHICNYKSHSAVVIDKESKHKKSIGGEGLFDYPSGMEIS